MKPKERFVLKDRVTRTVVFPDGDERTEKGVVVGLKDIKGRVAVEVRWNGWAKAAFTTTEWPETLGRR